MAEIDMQFKADKRYRLFMTGELLFFFLVCLYFVIQLKVSDAPDEAMRLYVPKFIALHGTLPTGLEWETIDSTWGISYALYPYLPSILGGYLARLAMTFGAGEGAILICSRLISALAGTGALYLFHKIGLLLFEDYGKSALFATLCAFLPQFVFLCTYHNNDSLSVFAMALQVYFWVRAARQGWTVKNCIGIAVGCGITALTYYFGCAYIIASIFFFFVSNAVQKNGGKKMLKSLIIIVVITAVVAGWFFLRNAYLHGGDFLGFRTSRMTALTYAEEGFKPGSRPSLAEQGVPLKAAFFGDYFGQRWFVNSWKSFIGSFSYLSVNLHEIFYKLYTAFYFVGLVLFVVIGFWKQWAKTRIWRVLFYTLLIAGGVTVAFSMYNTYFSDYQAQGRYVIGGMIPLMMFVTIGYGQLVKNKRAVPPEYEEDIGENLKRPIGLLQILTLGYLGMFIIVLCGYMIPMTF